MVLIEESQEEVNHKLEMQRKTLDLKNFCLSRNKTEYMKYKFNKRQTNYDLEVKI